MSLQSANMCAFFSRGHRAGSRYVSALALPLLLLCGAGFSSPGVSAADRGALHGTVSDSRTGEPILAAVITIERASAFSDDKFELSSDNAGRFILTDLPSGKYRIRAELSEYEPYLLDDIRIGQDTLGPVTITMSRIVYRDAPGCDSCPSNGLILGKVVDRSTGLPLEGARIERVGSRERVTTGEDGLFSFADVDSGTHQLIAVHCDYHPDSSQKIAVSPGKIARPTVGLRPLKDPAEMTGLIAGTINDSATAVPLSHATVSLLNTDLSTLSDSLGRFALRLVPPGTYTLLGTKWGYESSVVSRVTVREKERTPAEILLAQRAAGFSQSGTGGIAGSVTAESTGVFENAVVFVKELGNAALSDALGNFSIEDIPSGVYTVAAFAEGYDTTTISGVDVWEGEVSRVQLVLHLAPPLDESASTTGIAGMVVDAEEGAPLSGVAVEVEGRRGTALTDLAGRYSLVGLKPGRYTLVAVHDGYLEQRLEGLTVAHNKIVRADLIMKKTDYVEMQRMTVRGVAVRNTDAALLRERQQAFTVSDAVGAQEISGAGASTAADAVKMITGATIVDGKYVYIRGLGGRYVNTTLNGIELPSSDPNVRAVNLDLFPANLLDNLNIYKTFTPDMAGDFTGGTVDIQTRSLPDAFTFSLSASGGVNSQSTFRKEFLSYEGGKTDWLGFDDGTRALPEIIESRTDPIPSYGYAIFNADSAYLLDRVSKEFGDRPMAPTAKREPLSRKFSVNVGNTLDFGGPSLGFLFYGTYNRKFESYDEGQRGIWNNPGGAADRLAGKRLVDDHHSEDAALWGTLSNLALNIVDGQKLDFIHLYTRSGKDIAQYLEGVSPEDLNPDERIEARRLHYTQRGINFALLRGDHSLPILRDATIAWKAAYTSAVQNEPDVRDFVSVYRLPATQDDTVAYYLKPSAFPNPTHFWRDLTENNRVFSVDLTLPFAYPNGLEGSARTGFSYRRKEREYEARFLYVRTSNYSGDPESFFASPNWGLSDTTGGFYQFRNYIEDDKDTSQNYRADDTLLAWYLMGELPFTKRFSLVGGLRIEKFDMGIEGWNKEDTLTQGETHAVDFLPCLAPIIKFSDKMNLRLAYGKTVARPTFREKSPVITQDFPGDAPKGGNPDLRPSSIDNADLRWEWFPNPGELAAISAYYKYIWRPIELLYETRDKNEMRYDNVGEAHILGLELEGRKDLGFIHPAARGLRIGANLSLIRSAVDVDSATLKARRESNPDEPSTRPVQGQSPIVINLNTTYANEDLGLNAGIFFNIFGRRLALTGRTYTPDVYETPRPELNATFEKRLASALSISASAKNLLNPRMRKEHTFKDDDYTISDHTKGVSFSLGLKVAIN